MSNIRIRSIEIYHPANRVDNEFYIRHFDERGQDIRSFLAYMGRSSRYVIDNERENTLTMGIEAARKALAASGLQGDDIDLIVFSTQVPETTFPSNAMKVHAAIGAGSHTSVMDSNANCAGMTVAADHAARYMMSSPSVRRTLIVGSDYNTLISNPEQPITYANYGDAACAVVLERTDEEGGFIDSVYYTDSGNKDFIMYPARGHAAAMQGSGDARYIEWLPFDGSVALPPTYEMIERLLARNGFEPGDVKAYCCSQFSLGNILKIQERFELKDEQIVYVGDRFGYTGTSSPFIALYEGIATGRIRRGDLVLLWTIGAGYQLAASLFRY
ncbi:ketoacyl-ACP synthase III [Paenibacillus soyae]|uniref:3-oxoacyl-ACP synthase III family protein n=1 Tax=Paenibacillus soyae TaxID=2969249 RepID=A0A9X2SB35_9BACL|nr:3-oxoacyl-ACP synthase III family protein [Paenibacillus soyae]MCR2806901.1 3-oxoacyl-ACP synthase III family protein [Paenibacillus soyae]